MRTRIQSPRPDPLVGKVILSFRIERKLAEGGMGAVYLARHEELAHTLKVIKVLLPAYAEEPVLRQRFRREAEAASRLKHDKILGVDNFGTLEDGQLFMMVPFLEGEPLDAFLHERGGRLAPHRALHLAVQICDALDYAHARGIIHRDLKPGNVFVVSVNDNPYVPKLLDFGIAKLIGARELGPRTQSGVGIGTPGYMAVEQYARADEVTPAADVYSLAVVIWEARGGATAVGAHGPRPALPPAADGAPGSATERGHAGGLGRGTPGWAARRREHATTRSRGARNRERRADRGWRDQAGESAGRAGASTSRGVEPRGTRRVAARRRLALLLGRF